MAKRFLTAEDVRRLGGPEILLEGETVVTPQAAEAAATAGVAPRGARRVRTRPPSPTAAPTPRARAATLPHLPEPSTTDGIGLVVTVVGETDPASSPRSPRPSPRPSATCGYQPA